MIRPILACENPYKTAEEFVAAGWKTDFSQTPESGDPLVGISLYDNSVLLGVTEGYVANDVKQYVGCGVVFYLTVPNDNFNACMKIIKDLSHQQWKYKHGVTQFLK